MIYVKDYERKYNKISEIGQQFLFIYRFLSSYFTFISYLKECKQLLNR